MIVSELKFYNFRKFHAENGEPGLSVYFHKGLNALIGENDSGKSAIIDAIKLVLLTQSNEYLRVVEEDFYTERGQSVKEFRIDLTLSDFSENEAKNFVEILEFKKEGNKTSFYIHLHYRAWKEGSRIFTELRAGETSDGVLLDGKIRELLKCVYLRPLRDAEREMSSGRNSRISQILFNHPVFKPRDEKEHRLIEILRTANTDIEKYFTEQEGSVILSAIRDTLASFNEQDTPSDAKLETSAIQLKAILESLSLSAAEIHPGLGELNLLFIAAELLLLQHDDNGGLHLALIEELEAHLHPQAQLRLIQYLQKEYNESGITFPYLRSFTKESLQVVDDRTFAQHLWTSATSDRSFGTFCWLVRQRYQQSKDHIADIIDYVRELSLKNGDLHHKSQISLHCVGPWAFIQQSSFSMRSHARR